MAISLSGLKQQGARQASASRLAKEYEKQQQRESKRSGWSGLLGKALGALGGAAAIGLTGLTGGLAAPLIGAAASFGGKQLAHEMTKGMGAKTGKIRGDKYGYGGAEARTLKEGLEAQLRASDPSKQRGGFGRELLSSYVGAGMSGQLGGAKGLLKGDVKLGEALTGQEGITSFGDYLGGLGKDYGGLGGMKEGVAGLFDTSFIDEEGDPVIQEDLFETEEPVFGPGFAQGGIVQGKAPSIVEYFSMQGKTLGGSNTQSLSQMLGR